MGELVLNRRDFLRLSSAAAIAATAPVLPEAEPLAAIPKRMIYEIPVTYGEIFFDLPMTFPVRLGDIFVVHGKRFMIDSIIWPVDFADPLEIRAVQYPFAKAAYWNFDGIDCFVPREEKAKSDV